MIGGTPKPFACTSEGCTMTFTNEDHLNVHQRKHEMVLNFGTKNTNIVADQTPTPTRFLRNCEEVGLFQDLQNVNPFEETFRKAVELVKTGTLPVPLLPEDDTLHTPHIFPHIPEENISLYSSKKHDKVSVNITENPINIKVLNSSEKSETILTLNTHHGIRDHIYALTPVDNQKETPTIIISDSPEPRPNSHQKRDATNSVIKSVENTKSDKVISKAKYRKYVGNINVKSNSIRQNDTKTKLQQLLLKSKKQIQPIENEAITTNAPVIVLQSVPVVNSVVPILQPIGKVPILPKFKTSVLTNENVVENTQPNKEQKITKKPSKPKKNYIDCDTNKKEDLLARNRAAALRCRERKKVFIERLEQEKEVLAKENSDLKMEILQLKTLLLAHKDCPVTKAMNMGQSIPIGAPQIVEVPLDSTSSSSSNSNEIKIEAKNSDGTPLTISICDIKNLPADTSPKTNVLIWED